jgi:hypothetical protein
MKKILAYILILFCLPHFTDAAVVQLTAPESINISTPFSVEVFLDTEGENINAIEGTILLPEGFSVSEVRYQGSVVSLWLSAPAMRVPGTVDFAGVMPGGYQATPERTGRGNLFTLVLSARQPGTSRLSLGAETSVYANEGTRIPASKGNATIQILNSGAPTPEALGRDVYSPEPFTPVVVSGEPYGIDGRVLVFATQDKDSGVMKYEVGSSYFKFLPEALVSWIFAESPYVISKDREGMYLFVRAYDTAGNVRVGVAPSASFSLGAFALTWFVPGIVLLIMLGLILRILFRRGTMSPR